LNGNWFNPVVIWSDYNLKKNFGKKLKEIEHIFIKNDENATVNAAMMLAKNRVDWLISWATNPTSNTLRALIKNVWVIEWIKRISWYLLLNTKRQGIFCWIMNRFRLSE
jgi:phosphotransacetylase